MDSTHNTPNLAASGKSEKRDNGFAGNEYLALRNDFDFRVDGHRPILYPLDFIETTYFILTPIEGFALSLMDGKHTFSQLKKQFDYFIKNTNKKKLADIYMDIDNKVKSAPTQSGIGKHGVIRRSKQPVNDCFRYDPRTFVINPDDFDKTMGNVKTRLRMEKPLNVLAVPTHKCMTRCIYCYAERKPVKEMPMSRWFELIGQMRDLDIKIVSLDNGDTLARPDGIEFLERLLHYKMHFLLSTKSYVSLGNVKRLVEAGLTEKVRGILERRVQLSVDAVEPDVCQRVVGVKDYGERMGDTFDHFFLHGINPKVKGVITGYNLDQPRKIVEFFYPRGARLFQFVRYMRSFYHHKDDYFLQPETTLRVARQIDEIRDKYPDISVSTDIGTEPKNLADLPQEMKKDIWANRSGCAGGWSMLGISADGKAFLCEQMKIDDTVAVGDLSKESIMEVWNGKKMFDFIHPERECFKGAICHQCNNFESCMWEKGRCYRDAYFAYGSIHDTPPLCPANPRPGIRLT